MLVADVPDEGGHGLLLVEWDWKVVREAAAGEGRCDLWPGADPRRSADGSDIGTCESVGVR